MDLSKIISVAGKGGIFRVIAQGRQALIVESLIDGKRSPVPLSVRISSLDEISMFTTGEDIELGEVLQKLYDLEEGKESINHKSDQSDLEARFKKVLPDYDQDRVHTSDIRKVFQWYNLLLKAGEFEIAESEEKETAKKSTKKTTKKASAKSPTKAKTPKPKSAASKAPTQRKTAQRGS